MQTHAIAPEFFHGAISTEAVAGGLQPWRLDVTEKTLYATPDEVLLGRASTSAGVRVRLTTGGDKVGLRVAAMDTARVFDLVIGTDRVSTAILAADETDIVFDLPAGTTGAVEIWLPLGSPTVVQSVLTADGADAAPAADPRRRWLTYGSSISQCNSSHSPARSWPATAARDRNLALTCMGFGGNCHLETQVARVIRDQPADLITLKLGINVQGGSTLSPRTFEIQALGLVRLIREKHPETPIGIISPVISPPRETTPNAVNLSLTKMRDLLADAVVRLNDWGDTRVRYYDGLIQFPEGHVADYMPDELHPNGDGYEILGHNIAANVLADLERM